MSVIVLSTNEAWYSIAVIEGFYALGTSAVNRQMLMFDFGWLNNSTFNDNIENVGENT